jgi:hypothetical protein
MKGLDNQARKSLIIRIIFVSLDIKTASRALNLEYKTGPVEL